MSNDSTTSLLSRAWRGALVLCGIAVLLVITIHLIEDIWPWLVGIGLIAIVSVVARAIYRHRRGW